MESSNTIVQQIKEAAAAAIRELYQIDMNPTEVLVNATKPEFEGNYTIVLFALIKQLRKAPEQLGQELGSALTEANSRLFTEFNVIKGFLNLTLNDEVLNSFVFKTQGPARATGTGRVMVEYSSPNTNKPLHLGHLRNNFLGWSVAEILKAVGNDVKKTCIVNDRGIHICKSMIAWQLFGNGSTPDQAGMKGDHFVGHYYVLFSNEHKRQMQELMEAGQTKEEAEKNAPIMKATQEMLVDWEAGKPEVMALWSKMNGWVYEGFDVTYKRIGSDFQKVYYESETYLLGRSFVEQGLEKGVFFRKDDGSVWIDLTDEGLDEKLVLRKDGTSVYITQDLGLAQQKFEEFHYDKSLYVIADEQNYHMKVLKLILKKLGMPYADGIEHLSYGMVELPTGRMKSREGTVVDADDLVEEMVKQAELKTAEKSKVEEFSKDELTALYETIALGALKFFLLKVDPKKKMVFNPEESIDFHGFTGPFIQYTYARLKSIMRKAGIEPGTADYSGNVSSLLKLEKELIMLLEQWNDVLLNAAAEYNPAAIANYVYSVAKTCNTFYTEHKVLKAESDEKKALRLRICTVTADVIREGMGLLGIRVPERM